MTIRRGEDWGTSEVPPPGMPVVVDDAGLRALVLDARARRATLPAVGLAGGDLMRTLGGTGEPGRFASGAAVPHLPIDLVRVTADDERETVFVAHLVARRRWWRGQITALMNAEFLGPFDVAPRGHPNDGRADVVTVDAAMTLQQRLLARSRLRLGTHVPHPLIAVSSRSDGTVDLPRRASVRVDGVPWGDAMRLTFAVEPDALTVCI